MSNYSVILKREREKSGMSQDQLAAAAGVTKQMVSLWETGKKSVRFDTADRVFKALGVSVTIGAGGDT